jgi:RNA polymerase sigma-70 factor (ECF subfamily)
LADLDDADDDLLERLARAEPQAARELVARKLPRLLALAQRMLGQRAEAEDVAQEAFLRIWKQAPQWRPGEARLDTWLHRVVLNLCYDRLRSPRGAREQAVDEPPDLPDAARHPSSNSARPSATRASRRRWRGCRHASVRRWCSSTSRNCRRPMRPNSWAFPSMRWKAFCDARGAACMHNCWTKGHRHDA